MQTSTPNKYHHYLAEVAVQHGFEDSQMLRCHEPASSPTVQTTKGEKNVEKCKIHQITDVTTQTDARVDRK